MSPVICVVHAVELSDFAFGMKVAQHGKADAAKLFGIRRMRINAVYTDAHDLSIRRFKARKVALKGLQFVRSATCKIQHVETNSDLLFAVLLAECESLSAGVG